MKWISIRDRLPESVFNNYVLCITKGFVPYVGIYNAFGNNKWTSYGDEVRPTHWMPLPEPPEN